jgi:hypothetical protein
MNIMIARVHIYLVHVQDVEHLFGQIEGILIAELAVADNCVLVVEQLADSRQGSRKLSSCHGVKGYIAAPSGVIFTTLPILPLSNPCR